MSDNPSLVPMVGDSFTIANVFTTERNPDRCWWQFWRPRWVTTQTLQTFRVIGRA